MSISSLSIRTVALLTLLVASGCVTRPPTIAHVHVGHALSGVHVTPGQAGYLLVAEERAAAVRELSQKAAVATSLPQIKAGKLRALAISSDKRVPGVEVPTLKEQGIDVEMVNWRAIFGPPGITDAELRLIARDNVSSSACSSPAFSPGRIRERPRSLPRSRWL